MLPLLNFCIKVFTRIDTFKIHLYGIALISVLTNQTIFYVELLFDQN